MESLKISCNVFLDNLCLYAISLFFFCLCAMIYFDFCILFEIDCLLLFFVSNKVRNARALCLLVIISVSCVKYHEIFGNNREYLTVPTVDRLLNYGVLILIYVKYPNFVHCAHYRNLFFHALTRNHLINYQWSLSFIGGKVNHVKDEILFFAINMLP